MKTLAIHAIAALLLASSCHDRRAADQHTFTEGMKEYLARRGDLCVGKSSWPIDVTPADFAGHSRDAVQMPVLERLGLVHGEDTVTELRTEEGPVKREVRRYELTPAGQRYYLVRDGGPRSTSNAAPRRDLCVAKLSLDAVIGWDAPSDGAPLSHTVVQYTYHVDAAPWTSDPDVTRTFPMVARVLQGAGRDRLTEAFTLTKKGWVADDLLGKPGSSSEIARAEGK